MKLVESYGFVIHKVEPSDPQLYGCNGHPFSPAYHDQAEMEVVTEAAVKQRFPKAKLCKHCFPGQPEATSWQ